MPDTPFKETRLEAYRPSDFEVLAVDLEFHLDADRTRVHSKLQIRRAAHAAADTPLVLDGHSFELLEVSVDGSPVSASALRVENDRLVLTDVGDRCELEIRTAICPATNRSGEGLFVLNGQLATQCEAQGFRRMTYFLDRPDVLAPYTVTLIADREQYPVLLSNGCLVEKGENEDRTHWVKWVDPHPKPSYIFAVMAGSWSRLEDVFVTRSGKRVALAIYADPDLIERCEFAMGALKRSLAWEESTFGLEYDLDCYNIVALTDYMGAMENKGLNLFGADGIVADAQVSTDDDYLLIERILGHEVFHNWTGNRVTCRDWFQLSIKEGLTRFRDQLFAQDMSLSDYKRIDQVKALRRNQFPEDVGPAAHPVQPKAYLEIRNFYTATIYEKGAEVVRMLYHLLGRKTFIAGVRRYLDTHDYRATTKDDFLASLEAASGRNLKGFLAWYDQAGRPLVTASGHYDAGTNTYELQLSQRNLLDAAPGRQQGKPFPIPIAMGFIGLSGREYPVVQGGAATPVIQLTDHQATYRFEGLPEPVVPSLFRGFSAPVSYDSGLTEAGLAHLMAKDTDAFARWDAAQQLGVATVRKLAADWRAGRPLAVPPEYLYGIDRVLQAADRSDCSVTAELLKVPDEPVLSDGLDHIDLDAHVAARTFVCRALAELHQDRLLQIYRAQEWARPYRFEEAQIGARRLRNACLELLLNLQSAPLLDLCLVQVRESDNMTDSFEALAALCQVQCAQREEALAWFYERWRGCPRVLDKWFMVQALSRTADAVERFEELERHPDMDIMNAPRAFWFYGSFFRQNRVAFHDASGKGYQILVDRLLMLDKHKPGLSMRFMPQILQWRRYDPHRRQLMKAGLERLLAADGISRGLYETATNALREGPQS
jgi:aminopeptidase N